ncbi:MAG TPA: hypothetical protein DEF06_00900, partial [Clostridiales bacterium]|nr:hypothetical protein [Clostridiales bacterium]
MNADIIESYIEKVYGYAVNHTFSREEADELSQEILFTAVRELPKLKDDSKFELWLWGIASNVTKTFRRYMGKQRAMYSYDTLESFPYEEEQKNESEELYDALRTRIAMLSELYRSIIILFYYDGLSIKQISEKLHIPEGTVTWRLSEARKKLKKECTEMNETALNPVKLMIRINGEGNYKDPISPFPYVYISDALSQNILYYCYETPKTVEALAKLCGVPAYYIEDCLGNLMKREAVSEVSKGKYRTDFIIYSNETREYAEKAKGIFAPVVADFVSSMKILADAAERLGIYTAGKPKEELIYLYGILAMEHLSEKYNPIKWVERPVRYDGCRWSYHAYLMNGNQNPIRGLGREESSNLGSRGTYKHISYHFGGFSYREMMFDNEINICEDILLGRKINDTDSATSAIAKGFISKKENGKLFVTVPAFTKEQKQQLDLLADTDFQSSIDEYSAGVR